MSNRYRQVLKLASVIDALYEDAMHSPVMKKQALEDVRAGFLTKLAGKYQDDDFGDEDHEDLDLTQLFEDDSDEEFDDEDLAEHLEDEFEAMEDFEYPPPVGRKFY